jgi:hypothetical protein
MPGAPDSQVMAGSPSCSSEAEQAIGEAGKPGEAQEQAGEAQDGRLLFSPSGLRFTAAPVEALFWRQQEARLVSGDRRIARPHTLVHLALLLKLVQASVNSRFGSHNCSVWRNRVCLRAAPGAGGAVAFLTRSRQPRPPASPPPVLLLQSGASALNITLCLLSTLSVIAAAVLSSRHQKLWAR